MPGITIQGGITINYGSGGLVIDYGQAVAPAFSGALAVPFFASPWVAAYQFTFTGGFGTRYANPGTNWGKNSRAVAFNPSNSALAITGDSGVSLGAYSWDMVNGFGTLYSQTGLPLIVSADWDSTGTLITYAGDSATLGVVRWNNPGFGTSVSVGAGGTSWPAKFHPTNNSILSSNTTGSAPQYGVWAFNPSTVTFGAKYANPSNFTTGQSLWGNWHPLGTYVGFALSNSPYQAIYAWNNSTGFGIRVANPTTLPTQASWGLEWTPTGRAVIISGGSSEKINAYAWDDITGFGTRYTNPATLPAGSAQSMTIAKTGDLIAVSSTSSPFIQVYPWSDTTGWGVRYANPASLPTATAYQPDFTN